jgi:hypothetical protein
VLGHRPPPTGVQLPDDERAAAVRLDDLDLDAVTGTDRMVGRVDGMTSTARCPCRDR